MPFTTQDLSQARTDCAALLEALGLATYVFDLEPRERRWELQVECALIQGWQRIVLEVDPGLLARSRTEPAARERLLADWQNRLRSCRYA